MRPHTRSAHRPRALLAGALALAAGLLLAPAASAGTTPAPGERARSVAAPHCTMKGAQTIAANRHVRVFSARVRTWREVFGCRRSADRAYVIGDAGGECQNYDLVDSAVVAGNLAALNVRTCSLYGSSSSVHLVNLRDGRGRYAAAPLSTTGTDASYDAIRGMVLTATRPLRVDRRARRARRDRRGRGAPPRARLGRTAPSCSTAARASIRGRCGCAALRLHWRNAGIAGTGQI